MFEINIHNFKDFGVVANHKYNPVESALTSY